jgi:hypothetical protein
MNLFYYIVNRGNRPFFWGLERFLTLYAAILFTSSFQVSFGYLSSIKEKKDDKSDSFPRLFMSRSSNNLSSSPEELEPKQFPTAIYPIPAEVNVINTPEDLGVEIAALRGQMQTIDDLFASSLNIFSDSSKLQVQQGIDDATAKLNIVDGIAGQVQSTATQEQTESITLSGFQAALTVAKNAVITATQNTTNALTAQSTAKTQKDLADSKLNAQVTTVNTAQSTDTQKINQFQTATNTLNTNTKKYTAAALNYTNVHKLFTVAQTAYQRTPNNKIVKATYDLALSADTKAKQAQDSAIQQLTASQNALKTATQEKQTADGALSTARNTLTTLQSQQTTANQTYTQKTTAVTTAQNTLHMATTNQNTAQTNVDQETTKDQNLKNAIQAFLVDSRITDAINAVHQSAALLTTDIANDQAAAQTTAALSLSLASSIQSTLDAESQKIGYAKIYVSYEILEGQTRFTVRLRVPDADWIVEAKIDNGDGSFDYRSNGGGTEPQADSSWSFSLGMGQGGRGLTFRLRNTDTGEVLAEVHGGYDAQNNNASIDTTQSDFNIDEAGMLAENPIAPKLSVGKISGPTLLLITQTPHDQYYIDSDMAGLLSSTPETCEGGTTFGLSQITIDTGRATGQHLIRLYDRQGGQLLDTVVVNFDHNSRVLTLADPTDQYTGSTVIDQTDLAQKQQAMQSILSVPLGVGDSTIAHLQALNLYYDTANLPAPYNMVCDNNTMLALLYKQPENWKFDPANQTAAVQALWDSMGTITKNGVTTHTYDYHVAQDSIIRGREQLEQNYKNTMGIYEQAMSECLQSAINIFQGDLQGQPEEPLRYKLDDLYRKWSQDGTITMLRGIAIVFPNEWTIEMAAKADFYANWHYIVQTNADVIQQQEREEYFLQQGMRKTAEGDWVIATKGNLGAPPADLNTDELRLATKIGIAMGQSPQLFAKYTPEQRARIAGTTAILLGKNPTTEQITKSILTAIQTIDTEMNPMANTETGSASISPDQQTASDKIGTIGQRALYTQVLGWFDSSIGSLRQAFPIRTDSIVGKIIYAGTENLWRATSEEARWEVAYSLQRLTDIPAQKFMDQFTQAHGSVTTFGSNMTALLTQGQYGELFTVHQYFENPTFAGAYPNIPADKGSYDGSMPICIRFDLAPAGKTLQRLDVISSNGIIATTAGTTFVKFDMMAVGQIGANVQVTLRATFTDGTTIETESDPFNVYPEVTTAPSGFDQILSTVPGNLKVAVSEALNINIVDLPPGNVQILQHFIDAFLKNGNLHFDTNALGQTFELEGDMYDTNDLECKDWLQKRFIIDATINNRVDIPMNITKDAKGNTILSYEWNMNAPDLNGKIFSSDGKTEQVAAIRGNATFESMITSSAVKEGDIVQMVYGSTQHTMVLWKKESTGIWVFDTNFGEYGKGMLPDGSAAHIATGALDSNGHYYDISDKQVNEGAVRTHWYQADDTVRLHFLSYADLNSKATYASTYQIQ